MLIIQECPFYNYAREDFQRNSVTMPTSLEFLFGVYNKRILAAPAGDIIETQTSVISFKNTKESITDLEKLPPCFQS